MRTREDTIVSTTTRHRLEITRADILAYLASAKITNLPPRNADIFVQVPGGGDWSNTSLDISDENPVVVSWEEQTIENSDG
jgi:predicted ATP-dependent serine protease